MILDYLKNKIIITDGAMGTYYSQISKKSTSFPELANIYDPQTIESIHRKYIESGANLIRTNTFSVNSSALNCPKEEMRQLLIHGYKIAKKASAGKDIFIAANIGPISERIDGESTTNGNSILDEYKFIIDTFLELDAEIFNFETFSSIEHLKDITSYIKQKNKSAFILAQFAITIDGFTRKGISKERVISEVKNMDTINAYGFNCGVGPTHLYNLIKRLNFSEDIVSVLPNAGYPEIVNERTIYVQNPQYFADIMANVKDLGVKILGGCCGTTPMHIKALSDRLKDNKTIHYTHTPAEVEVHTAQIPQARNTFSGKINSGKFLIAVELDPPFNTSIDKLIHGSRILKENGVDMITIADSPMARARVDSITIAAKIKREIGIETMPHICCRDKNINAIKSTLLAAYIEDIRNVLAVTGDPIPSAFRNEIKSVFNLNSLELIKLISEMNNEVFAEERYNIAGALNLNTLNKDVEISRMHKKVEKGARFFLTQPIFSSEAIEYLRKINRQKDIKILGGLMPIVSYKNAQFLNNEIPGIQIPQAYIDRFENETDREKAERVGIDITLEIADKIKKYVDGFYIITPFNRVEMVLKILKEIN